MRRLRLSRTMTDAAAPILHEGVPAIGAAAAILEHVGRGVPQLAGFLAEPVIAADRNTIDWYATISGTAIPLASLQGGDKVAAEERLQFRLGQLRSLATATTDTHLKALLEAAAHYPGPDSVFVVGQEPVLTQWGSRARGAAAEGLVVDAGALGWAAALHDTQRFDDGIDPEHGSRAAEWMLTRASWITPDPIRDRVLILDVYRVELEPYWVPLQRLFDGMATVSESDGESRGYLAIRLPARR